MLGAASALQFTVDNLEMDAAVSRQVSEGIGILQWRRDNGLLGDVVVIHLGNNGTFTGGQMEQIMSILEDVDRIVFVTLKVPRSWEAGNNEVIWSVADDPKTVIVDWNQIGNDHPGFFYEDKIHLRADGAYYYAGLLAQHIQPPE